MNGVKLIIQSSIVFLRIDLKRSKDDYAQLLADNKKLQEENKKINQVVKNIQILLSRTGFRK
jgi:hypothetical protein